MTLCAVRLGDFRPSILFPLLHACIEGILYYYNGIEYEPRTILYSFELGGLLGLYLEELVFDFEQDVKQIEEMQKQLEAEPEGAKKKDENKIDKCVTIIEEHGHKKRKPLFIFRRYPKPRPKVQTKAAEKKRRKEEKEKNKMDKIKKKRKRGDLID